jgi:putative oxidoreductase
MDFYMHKIFKKLLGIAACKIRMAETYLAPLVLLAIRLHVGLVFWRSGMTKFANLDSARTLFEYEYLPLWQENHVKNILGLDIPFPVPDAGFASMSATMAELTFAPLLMLGLGSRMAAFGIFMLALTVDMFVYPGMVEHDYWFLTMAVIIALGPGKISADYFIRKKWMPQDGHTACKS